MLETEKLKYLLEAILLAADKAMTEEQLLAIFSDEEKPTLEVLRQALQDLQASLTDRGIELVQVASGYRFQIKTEWAPWVSRLWEEKAQRYSRALLETLALIAYRQPITRGEIEDIRGVTVSTSIIKTLLEDREWIRVVGHREVPGRPALFATTKTFLDYFGLKNLQDLPPLPDVLNLDTMDLGLEMHEADALAKSENEGEEVILHVSSPVRETVETTEADSMENEALEVMDETEFLDEEIPEAEPEIETETEEEMIDPEMEDHREVINAEA
jgi:segregation and condensation protein B